jgi:hypothetical protein
MLLRLGTSYKLNFFQNLKTQSCQAQDIPKKFAKEHFPSYWIFLISRLGHSIPIVSIPRSRKYRTFFGIEISELIRLNIDIFDISEF